MIALLAILFGPTHLEVGDGKPFARIEAAIAAAHAGDTIDVFPITAGFGRTAVRVLIPHLTIEGMGETPIRLDGVGFDYSGEGSIPRAIFQFDPAGHDAVLRNFELSGAHNASHNGAGVRIQSAQNVKIERCDIHGNDMGVMSNGSSVPNADGANQLFLDCHIHNNGDAADPGYNHNLYLGGMSATLRRCEVDHSLTGHNVKSRAHFTLVEDCYIHDSANREFDFVEAGETERPNSNAAIVNCVIAKDPNCAGNRVTIHFGREHGIRNGVLWVVHCTVLTPFASPVIALDGADVGAEVYANIVVNTAQAAPTLVEASGGARLLSVAGGWNWLSAGYQLDGTQIDPKTRYQGTSRAQTLGLAAPTFLATQPVISGRGRQVFFVDLDGNGLKYEVKLDSLGAHLEAGGWGLVAGP